jgi:AAA domain/Bifunctional DNA primase/polymerase, N-terminal
VTPDGHCRCGGAHTNDPKAIGKHGGKGWKEHATGDPKVIRDRFRSGDPNYLVIPAESSQLVIIDEDVPGALEVLGDLPATLIVATGVKDGGVRGRHLYGRLPAGTDETDLTYDWAGGEVRFAGNGGVVGPLSRHASGATYDPISPLTVGTLPAALITNLIHSGRKRATERDTAHSPKDPGWIVGEPGRHPWLASMAGRLRRDGLGGDALRDALQYLNRLRCRPEKPEDEVERIAAWADRQEGDSPADTGRLAALRFYTPTELASITPSKPDFLVGPGLVATGAITEIDGKVKVAGKTTLILHMIRSILDGVPFLGQPTRKGRVVYVTEQTHQTFADALRRAGLDQRGDELLLLFREDIGATVWADVVAATARDGYEVAVFDTLGKLARIKQENEAGEWAAAMSPLQDLAASGRAVIVARHDRKSGGDVGDSARGSSQASGDADIILGVRRPEGNQPTNRRVIEGVSRYAETPEKIVVELTGNGYVLLGTDEAVAVSDARAFLSTALGREFRQNGTGLDMKALEVLGEEHVPAIKRTTIQTAVDQMVRSGEILKTGRGVRGDPFVYLPVHPSDKPVLPELGRYSDRTSSSAALNDGDSSTGTDEPDPHPGAALRHLVAAD